MLSDKRSRYGSRLWRHNITKPLEYSLLISTRYWTAYLAYCSYLCMV